MSFTAFNLSQTFKIFKPTKINRYFQLLIKLSLNNSHEYNKRKSFLVLKLYLSLIKENNEHNCIKASQKVFRNNTSYKIITFVI